MLTRVFRESPARNWASRYQNSENKLQLEQNLISVEKKNLPFVQQCNARKQNEVLQICSFSFLNYLGTSIALMDSRLLSVFHLILADIWAIRAYEHLILRMGRGNERRQENQTSEILLVNRTLNFFLIIKDVLYLLLKKSCLIF